VGWGWILNILLHFVVFFPIVESAESKRERTRVASENWEGWSKLFE
jgi:hypothetical protein